MATYDGNAYKALEQLFGKRFSVDMYYLVAVLHFILGLNWLHFI